jgi:nucleoside-diphosphate-sugar epimerase
MHEFRNLDLNVISTPSPLLITGATGFIGTATARRFKSLGPDLRVFVRDQSRLQSDLVASGVTVVSGDMRDALAVERAVKGVRAIIHLAAATSGDWQYRFETTAKGTETLVSAAEAADVEMLIHVSSMSVYDFASLGSWQVLDESSPLELRIGRRNDYARSKAAADESVRSKLRTSNIALTILRPGIVYGPGGRLPLITTLRPIRRFAWLLIGGGTRLLPMVYVDNLVDAFEAVLLAPDATRGRIYNVVDDEMPTELRYLEEIHRLKRVPGRIIPVNSMPFIAVAQTADLVRTILRTSPTGLAHGLRRVTSQIGFSAARLKGDTGWRPRVTFREGLVTTVSSEGPAS